MQNKNTFKDSSMTQHKKWIKVLSTAKNNQENSEILKLFFSDCFLESQENFYQFLITLKKEDNRLLANNYFSVISPLCEKFGFYIEKYKLDDHFFQINNPIEYSNISKILENYQKKSDVYIKTILKNLKKLLKDKYECEIIGRYKNLYSIHKKILKNPKKYTVLTLKDIFAFRVICKDESIDTCYQILNLLHDKFIPITTSFKDYIAIPKINGYQSLHTGIKNLIPDLDLPVEIQIRTQMMDKFAKQGTASHWLYQSNKKANILTEKEKKLLDHINLQAKNFKDSVFCLTKEGDILTLPNKSTIIDFAYLIHSDLGNKTELALVNKKRVELNYTINNCDTIEIVKANRNTVQPEWSSIAKTKKAKTQIAISLSK
jgi:guanosine-3',5'-bis(diphosphate) 3'-pyrophosphohydrolase